MMLEKFLLQQGGYLLYDITNHVRTFPSNILQYLHGDQYIDIQVVRILFVELVLNPEGLKPSSPLDSQAFPPQPSPYYFPNP
jgi:hypothetical protein